MSDRQLLALLPLNVDSTMISCFRSCPRKFFLEFVYGIRPAGLSIDLHAGGCFAAALEEVYRQIYTNQKTFWDAAHLAYARYLLEWGNFEIPSYKRTAKTMDRVWEAIMGDGTTEGHGYFEEYPVHSDHVKPLIASDGRPTLEYTFAIPLEPHTSRLMPGDVGMFPEHPDGGPFLYSGRFDMLGLKSDGKVVPLDNKTTGRSPGVEWSRMWQLRSQFIGYVWALRQCGIHTDEMCIRGTAILKESIKHAEHFQTYSDVLIDRWHEQLRRDLWRIRRMWDEGYWDFNLAESCTAYGNCVFMDSCTSPDPTNWLSDMEVRRWNPLLKNPTAVASPANTRAIS